jgi:hypothetical protein
LSRICELELTKNKWLDISLSTDELIHKFVKRIENKFVPIFNLMKAQFDNMGFLLFKISFLAMGEGIKLYLYNIIFPRLNFNKFRYWS